MTGRGIDQVLPYPSDPRLHEPFMASARGYVELAEQAGGSIFRLKLRQASSLAPVSAREYYTPYQGGL
jgi:hypothetical protein